MKARPETLLAQVLGHVDETTGALAPPVHLSTTFERDPDRDYPRGYSYSRSSSPAWSLLERLLAELEGGAEALVLGSGMAAATLPFMALPPGSHVVTQATMYWGVRSWLADQDRRGAIRVSMADHPDDIPGLIRPDETRLVWIESPANPTFRCTDIAATAACAHAAGARLVVDSTVATPLLTRPIEHGADLVMHSGTKYLNGHGDVLAGVLVTAREDGFWAELVRLRAMQGAVLGPFEAWLMLRGMRTLHLRVRQCSQNALALARHFENHPRLRSVLYPGLTSAPDHEVARRQMQGGFGGMLSIRLAGGESEARKVAARVRVFKRATSLGGVESLIEHRASIEGEGTPVPPDLLRLSVGIEHIDDLVGDLEAAIDGQARARVGSGR